MRICKKHSLKKQNYDESYARLFSLESLPLLGVLPDSNI